MKNNKIPHFEIYPNHGIVKQNAKFITRLIYKVIPRNVFLQFLNEFYFYRLRLKSSSQKKKFLRQFELKVNIGAGPKGKEGWINVDAYKQPGINCIYDCRTELPFQDESVDMIFCEHFVEHLDYTEEIPFFFTECKRVLKKGGVMRIIVPDTELYIKGYVEEGWESLKKVRPLTEDKEDYWMHFKYQNKMELLNIIFRQGIEHKYAYDYENMEYVLNRFGFSKVFRQKFNQSQLSELALDSPERGTESLYVEVVKE
ncbi:hypothetical protein BH23BAC1_BH23BAC1_21180 [soil metagenome]